jgi:SET domain
MHPQPAATYCEIRQTDNKGLGLFAKVDIKEGTVISDEINIKVGIGNFEFSAATWQNPDFWQHFKDHGGEDLETAMSGLISYYKDDVFQHIVFDRLSRSIPEGLSDKANLLFTNGLSPKSHSPPNWITFGPTTCAFNHSCISNAILIGEVVKGDPTRLRYQVMALKDIEAHIEITVSYGLSNLPTAERRLKIRDIFRFDCVCEVCIDESIDTRENYAIVNRLLPDITAPPEHEIKRRTPWRFFKKALELAETYHKLGIMDSRFAQL